MIAANVSAAPNADVARTTLPGSAPEPNAPAMGDDQRGPLDDTAEPRLDPAAALADAFSRRAALVLLRQQTMQQDLQMRLDRLRATFNSAQEFRSERLRQMNALRDMAVEQSKKDDEILKKYIAMI